MRRAVRTTLAAVLIVVANAGDTACPAPDNGDAVPRQRLCDVDTRGVEVESGGAFVVDVVTATCQPPGPLEHKFEAWLEYKPGVWGDWTMPRFPRQSFTVPGQEGLRLRVELPCKEGYYRAAWRTTGRGPALPDHPNGIEFDRLDADFGSTRVDGADCRG